MTRQQDDRRRTPPTGRAASLVLVAALAALAVAGTVGPPAAAQGGGPTFLEDATDGAWVGLMRFGDRLLPLQINVNARDGGGLVQVILPEDLGADRPGELQVLTAVDTDAFTGPGGDDEGGGNDDDDDDLDDGDDDCCYGIDLDVETGAMAHRDRHLRFMVEVEADEDVNDDGEIDDQDVYEREFELTHDDGDDVLEGEVRSTRPGERNGQVELRRMSTDRPLHRLWTGTANVDGSGRGDVTLLLDQDGPTSFPRVTEKMTAGVTGRVWFDGRVGSIENAELDGDDLDGTISIPGSADIELTARLIRRDTRLRAQFDGRGGLMRPATTRGRPMNLRRVVDDQVAPGDTTTVRIRARNLEEGALAHFSDPDVQVRSVEVVNPRILDVLLEIGDEIRSGSLSVLVVNVDGQEDQATDAIDVTGVDDGDDGDDDGATVSFADDVQPIFTTNCALSGCHLGPNAQEGQNLEAGEAYDNIVEVPSNQRPELFRIDPGNPDDSYLVMKIRGDSGIEGSRMPFGRSPLSQAEIDTIVSWVQEGAPRN